MTPLCKIEVTLPHHAQAESASGPDDGSAAIRSSQTM
jgi:hypothetical protein